MATARCGASPGLPSQGAPTLDAAACPGGGRVRSGRPSRRPRRGPAALAEHAGRVQRRAAVPAASRRTTPRWRSPSTRSRRPRSRRAARSRSAARSPTVRRDLDGGQRARFIGAEFPITSSAELAVQATEVPRSPSATGSPSTARSTPSRSWRPGASAPYIDTVPRRRCSGADEPGVYWFGVHALGTNAAGRDGVADGRARTFLPYVPPEGPRTTRRHRAGPPAAPPGRCTRPTAPWPTSTTGSRPSARAVGSRRSSTSGWPRAACRSPGWSTRRSPTPSDALVDGNPPAQLVDTARGRDRGGRGPDATRLRTSESALRGPRAPGAATSAETPRPSPSLAGQARPGRRRQDQVLALPYGDVDVAAAAERDARSTTTPGSPSGTVLTVGQAPITPAVWPHRAATSTTRPSPSPTRPEHPGLRPRMIRGGAQRRQRRRPRLVVFYVRRRAEGGPGPDDPTAALAMRQRMPQRGGRPDGRARTGGRSSWCSRRRGRPGPDYTQFFGGLDVNWLHLTSMADATAQPAAAAGRPDRFAYPPWQVDHEVDDAALHLVRRPDRGGDAPPERDHRRERPHGPDPHRRASATCPTPPRQRRPRPGGRRQHAPVDRGASSARSGRTARARSSCPATTGRSRSPSPTGSTSR